MATLTEAERARAQKAEFLRRLGAHAIGVELVDNVTDEEAKRTTGAAGTARKSNTAETRKRSTSRGGRSNMQRPNRNSEFAVIAYFEEAPTGPLPDTLEVRSGNRRVHVPLTLRLAPRFQLE
jgi:hypothetical protein